MTSAEIRKAYIDFFVQKHGHTFVPSSSVVPHEDPSLLFTNAGMNQFKPIFLATEKRAYTRAVDTQKCIRAGGKHNDLDDVGRSRRHHTFFEMLGNWSFGDYFKQGAIEMAWELITKVFKFDPARIHVTCYEGDPINGVPRDTEAAEIWKKVAGLEDDHIHFLGKDNFWEMGETGPCGPSTEIFIDRTPDKTGGPSVVSGDDPRVMEFWNNVFIQYNRDASGKLTTLPAQHVDTGMGFERVCSILQDKGSNYDIDLWDPFWTKLKELSGHQYGGKFPWSNIADPIAEAGDERLRKDIACRVIADHVRCLTFALTDGAVVSNEGRGYVLRRILRRAVRFGRQQLGLRDPFLHKFVPIVVEAMGDAFPELKKDYGKVTGVIRDEEISFSRTIDRGIELFDEAVDRALTRQREGVTDGVQINGDDAFKLHDTYGFPIDLTRIMAEERGFTVDLMGYEKKMVEQQEKSRGKKDGNPALGTLPPDALATLEKRGIAPTDDGIKYEYSNTSAKVVAIWDGSSFTDHIAADAGDSFAVILDRTPFYAEMGGQVGDAGLIKTTRGGVFLVGTTKTTGKYVLHIGERDSGDLRVGDEVNPSVDDIRTRTEQNHTSTHLANWALREVLGDEINQKGSLVDPEKLRFDFSYGKGMTDEEIARTETLVNEAIEKELNVYSEEAPQEQALKINGLRAVFGEKYPPMVRVVSIGVPVADLLANPGNPEWRGYSVEFCGGTHLTTSTEAGSFVIMSEGLISKGIRRIVAHTGDAAKEVAGANEDLQKLLDAAPGTPDEELPMLIAEIQKTLADSPVGLRAKRKAQATVGDLQGRFKAFEKTQKQASAGSVDVGGVAGGLIARAGGKPIVAEVPGAGADQLNGIVDSIKKQSPSYAVLLGSAEGGKVSFIAACSEDVIAGGLKAGDWVKEAAKTAGGGGGGRPNHAQAGGKDPAKLGEALDVARAFAAKF